MSFNYQAGYTPALRNIVVRSESILREQFRAQDENGIGAWFSYGSQNSKNIQYPKDGNFFYRFTNSGKSIDESRRDPVGIAGCGYSGATPTATSSSSGYDSNRKVLSNCDEFQSYPYINNIPREITCKEWNCNEYEYYLYWLRNVPRNKCYYTMTWNEVFYEGNGYITKQVKRPVKCNWHEYIFGNNFLDRL